MRSEKCLTASGSSAQSVMVSAIRLIAPAGVLSSWDTFVTKSRRVRSNVTWSVTSRKVTLNKPSPTDATVTAYHVSPSSGDMRRVRDVPESDTTLSMPRISESTNRPSSQMVLSRCLLVNNVAPYASHTTTGAGKDSKSV